MRILVADDQEGFTDFLSEFISNRGHQVDKALDGSQALDLVGKNVYDVVFLDFTMPGFTGLELVDHVKAKSPAAKLFLITAYAGVEEEMIKAAGMHGLLFKPFELHELEKILADAVC